MYAGITNTQRSSVMHTIFLFPLTLKFTYIDRDLEMTAETF